MNVRSGSKAHISRTFAMGGKRTLAHRAFSQSRTEAAMMSKAGEWS
jgi:hypothetical protein